MIDPEELLEWYSVAQRDLPWRRPGVSAWQILVSEFMLQQTPVARVDPIWRDWVARWPTPSATADAGAAAVVRAWGKLGYPRRAKRLHECAEVIATRYDDVVPDDVETLLTLPGIGTYTARAVACFAYGQRVPVVDTNVRRVVARTVHGLPDVGALRLQLVQHLHGLVVQALLGVVVPGERSISATRHRPFSGSSLHFVPAWPACLLRGTYLPGAPS